MAFSQFPPVPLELRGFADYAMSTDPSRAELERTVRGVDRAIAAEPDEAARTLLRAMRDFLVGFAVLGRGDTETAEELFERTIEQAREANALRESSEGYRVVADAENQLLDLRGTGYRLLSVGRARRAAESAVALDPGNPLARIAATAFHVNAPAIAGGDREAGLRHLEEARRLAGESEYVRFLVFVWEGRVAVQDGRMAAAEKSFARAHAIYPENWWMRALAREAGVRLPDAGDTGR